jgi:cell division cycle 2-like protein
MTSKSSRWADSAEDAVVEAQRKKEKEEKRRLKAEREAKKAKLAAEPVADEAEPPAKKQRLSPAPEDDVQQVPRVRPTASWGPCRHVDEFEKLNHIEEGSYGWVFRAKEEKTGEIVALKKLKMENANDGFPVTGLREIQTLMAARHKNIVGLREVVTGDSLDE